MIRSARHNITPIINALLENNFKLAKELTQFKCKTIPEKQAQKVGQVVGALCDSEGRNNPDLAANYLNLFNGV